MEFFIFCFCAKMILKQCLVIFSIANNRFLPFKISPSDFSSRIFEYFPKRLTHDFGQKMAIVSFLFLGKNNLEIVFGHRSIKRESFLDYKNMHFRCSRIFGFFPKRLTHSFGQKIAFFLIFCFQAKIMLQQYLGTVSIKKNCFQPIKIFTPLSRIFVYFAKGLTHDSGQKMAFFYFLFLSKKNLEITFGDLLERKQSFQGCKNMHLRQSHSFIFSIVTHDFGFLGKNDLGVMFGDIFDRKE